MKDWIKELCPEISDWQVELIDEAVQRAVAAERDACAKVCDNLRQDNIAAMWSVGAALCSDAIRARGDV